MFSNSIRFIQYSDKSFLGGSNLPPQRYTNGAGTSAF